jgi:hypothetical protein
MSRTALDHQLIRIYLYRLDNAMRGVYPGRAPA